jgi:Na+-transporting NADH:ubiquinone oxidoreductase subunit A
MDGLVPERSHTLVRRSKTRQSPSPIIPTGKLDNALPRGLLPLPLMRALSVKDSEVAQRLGCLNLAEDDMALLTNGCTSGSDYGSLLRQVLDELAADS